MGLYGNYDQSELRLPTVIMDTEYDPSVTMDGASDVEDEEPTERRHRRDFVGTELERPKKGSRKSHRKRQQPSQSQINQNEAVVSTKNGNLNEDSSMETDVRKNSKKRQRNGHIHVEDADLDASNSTMETALSPHKNLTDMSTSLGSIASSKKKAGPLGVKGATRSFNVVLDNDMTPEEAIAMVADESIDIPTVSKMLGNYLWESKVALFVRCFNTFSREQMCAWLKETIEIEKGEGMATFTGSRRKTPGGVFFTLIGRDATDDQKLQTVGIPRIKAADADRSLPHRLGTVQGKAPIYTPFDNSTPVEDDESVAIAEFSATPSPLDPSRAKRNPFALSSLPSNATPSNTNKPIGTIFGTSEEDLGEAVSM